ncbi:FAD-dependent oxidoreductase [Litorivivens sp.]|uniref:FAD-dependent oxidoreductase n=1 Tax=Litorivivens sp. TaxID=2020868 RepID=UPI0035652732
MSDIIPLSGVEAFDLETDVLVAGLGGAGASAALEARRAGAAVTVLESSSGGGGSTQMSACEMYLGGGTRLQRDLGIADSPDNFYNYLKACFGDNCDENRLRLFCDGAVEHFDWAESLGVPYKRGFYDGRDVVAMTGDSLQYTGNERAWPFVEMAQAAPRGHLPADADHSGGLVFMGHLLERVRESGVNILCDARITALVQDEQKRVVGAAARIDNRQVLIRAHRGVVLCTGGFIMNEAMTRKHLPTLDGIATRHGNPGDRGDGIRLGQAAGGNLINMGEAFVGIAHYPPAQLTYGIFVNEQGQRFINEDVYLARLGHYATQQSQGRIFMFIDNRHFERPAYLNVDIVAVGETVEEVESEGGLPAGNLQHTVDYYNQNAALGQDPLFHKASDWLMPLDEPPYALVSYALDQIRPPVFTLGGLEVQPTGEVLRPDGSTVEGLFAAGRTVAGIPRTSAGYASGMSVADVTFFGRLAGRQAAAQS